MSRWKSPPVATKRAEGSAKEAELVCKEMRNARSTIMDRINYRGAGTAWAGPNQRTDSACRHPYDPLAHRDRRLPIEVALVGSVHPSWKHVFQ